jgi:phosphinothricin acetyltransferase
VIAVRPADAADAGAIAAIYAPYVLGGTVSFEVTAPDAATIADRMAAAGDRYPWLVAVRAGEVVGYAHASQFSSREAYRWAVETTIYVAQGDRRGGVGRRLYGALLATLGAQGYTQAIGRISLPNHPSIGLHERLGFRQAGVLGEIGWKDGRWVDVAYWQCALGAAGDPPAEPEALVAAA